MVLLDNSLESIEYLQYCRASFFARTFYAAFFLTFLRIDFIRIRGFHSWESYLVPRRPPSCRGIFRFLESLYFVLYGMYHVRLDQSARQRNYIRMTLCG